MPKITYIDLDGAAHTCEVANGLSVMEGAVANGVPGILAICGGSCACSTCHAYVDSAWLARVGAAADIEDATLDLANERRPESRLTCQIQMRPELDGLIVHVAKND
ncbi:MAG: 2Fe-2S iron-sulfur cluster binding domain-containing protein [Gammaproteobacteria bacterium]|nr:2Fe-2S iron-sulfur cluster binding domain-containing protein [Gammaproteobacteria bacterium]